MNTASSDANYTDIATAIGKCEGREEAKGYLADLASSKAFVKGLAALGFRQFAPFIGGKTSAVVQATSGQLLRLTILNDAPRAKALEMVQPIQTYTVDGITVEVLPKLSKATLQAHQDLKRHLNKRRYTTDHFSETGDDTGMLPDGTPLCLDRDGLESQTRNKSTSTVEPAIFTYDSVEDAPWVVEAPGKKSALFDFLPEGIISKQEHYFPALMDHRPRDVLTDEDKAILEQGGFKQVSDHKPECFKGISDGAKGTQSNLSEFMELVFDKGFYPSQAQQIMRERGTLQAEASLPDMPTKPGGIITSPSEAQRTMFGHPSEIQL